MAFGASARAALATSVTAVRQTAKSPADSPKQRDAIDSSFDLNPGIISSLNGAATSREGKLVQKEDVVVGLENTPRAFMRLFTGENFGKQLVKVTDAAA